MVTAPPLRAIDCKHAVRVATAVSRVVVTFMRDLLAVSQDAFTLRSLLWVVRGRATSKNEVGNASGIVLLAWSHGPLFNDDWLIDIRMVIGKAAFRAAITLTNHGVE